MLVSVFYFSSSRAVGLSVMCHCDIPGHAHLSPEG